jgi:hypothetical protein
MSGDDERYRFESTVVASPPLDSFSASELEAMREAAEAILECHRVLKKTNHNIVSELLRDKGTFYQWDHYPAGDVRDNDSGSHYYYHSHRIDGEKVEHGHFHTFVRVDSDVGRPGPGLEQQPPPEDALAMTHLVAVSMDGRGLPRALFTTNRWVTGEAWRGGDEAIGLLGRFEIDHAWPSWPVNIWLTNLLRLFRPTIETLIRHRDLEIASFAELSDEADILEDRRLDVVSIAEISLERQIADVIRALQSR